MKEDFLNLLLSLFIQFAFTDELGIYRLIIVGKQSHVEYKVRLQILFFFIFFKCELVITLKWVYISSSISKVTLLSSIFLLIVHFIIWRFTIIVSVVFIEIYIRILSVILIISLFLLTISVKYTFLVKLLQFISTRNKRILQDQFRLFITHHSKIGVNRPKVAVKLFYFVTFLSKNCGPILIMVVLYFVYVTCALKKSFQFFVTVILGVFFNINRFRKF